VIDHALPVVAAIAAWWLGTGVVLYLDRLPRRTYRWSMAAVTVALLGALCGIAMTRDLATAAGAYAAFALSLVVWAWIEMSFLMGFVTGPRAAACPPGARGWSRVGYALQAIAYHELALVAGGAIVFAFTAGGGNRMALWTYLILWVMRTSAKLNVFLGVRNLSEDLLPAHVAYLATYFRRARMNALFPFAVAGSTAVAVTLWSYALAAAAPFEVTALTLAATLVTLAVIEHWFLVLPFSVNGLWQWSLRSS
jgi:putative photosynthetic complex assembly protein 2